VQYSHRYPMAACQLRLRRYPDLVEGRLLDRMEAEDVRMDSVDEETMVAMEGVEEVVVVEDSTIGD